MSDSRVLSLVDNVARHGQDPARVALAVGSARRTYADLAARARMLARSLTVHHGVTPGERVALLCRNRIEYFEIELGVAEAGAILVAMSWRYAPDEVRSVLTRSGASVAVVDPEFLDVVTRARADGALPRLRTVVTLGRERGQADATFEELMAGVAPEPEGGNISAAGHPTPPAGVALARAGSGRGQRLDDAHEIIFTSGTTGVPKGAVWTTGGLVWNALQQIADFDLTRDSVTYVGFDLNYIGGRHQFVWGILLQGGRVHVKPSAGFDPAAVLDAVERHGVTHILLVPTMLRAVLDEQSARPRRAGSLRMVMCGGSPVPVSMLEDSARILPGVWVAHVYGLTEGGGTLTWLPPGHGRQRPGSAGLPSLNVRLRIMGPDGPAPAGEIGEIQALAPTLCAGYWEDEAATEALFDDGWLRTGDLGFLDADGYLHVTGRSKELIITGGMNVFPAEVEAVLESHPKVRSAAVFGLPDERWGETVVAAVERSVETSEEAVTAEDLIEHCRAHLSGHKKPTRLWFVDTLPRTQSGKIRRQELIAQFSQAGGHDA